MNSDTAILWSERSYPLHTTLSFNMVAWWHMEPIRQRNDDRPSIFAYLGAWTETRNRVDQISHIQELFRLWSFPG